MQYKLKMSPEQVIEQAVHAVKRARNHTNDVEFSCEDAGRSEIDFLCRIIEAAISAGAGQYCANRNRPRDGARPDSRRSLALRRLGAIGALRALGTLGTLRALGTP